LIDQLQVNSRLVRAVCLNTVLAAPLAESV
jgi:hypothetical protein